MKSDETEDMDLISKKNAETGSLISRWKFFLCWLTGVYVVFPGSLLNFKKPSLERGFKIKEKSPFCTEGINVSCVHWCN